VHLPPRKALEKRVCHAPHFLQFFNPRILSDGNPDEKREMMGNLKEDDIQKHHTTAPEQLTDQELLLRTISAADLARKRSVGWDKEHPKCLLFCCKTYSSIVMSNLGDGPRFAYVSPSARHQNNKLLW
jgi:hypothetical protein